MFNILMNFKDIDKILWKLTHQSLILYEWINIDYWWTTHNNCHSNWNFFLLKIICKLLDVITSWKIK